MPLTEQEQQNVLVNSGYDTNKYRVAEQADGSAHILPLVDAQPTGHVGMQQPGYGGNLVPTTASSSIPGAALRGAAMSALPAIGGGLMAGLGALDLTPAAPVAIPLTILAGLGSAYAASKAQNAAMPLVLGQNNAQAIQQQLALDQQQHPYAQMLGGAAANVLGGLSPSLANVGNAAKDVGTLAAKYSGIAPDLENLSAVRLGNMANVGLGAGIQGGLTAAQGDSGKDALIQTVLGALFNKPNSIGTGMYGFHPTGNTGVETKRGTGEVSPEASKQVMDMLRQQREAKSLSTADVDPSMAQGFQTPMDKANFPSALTALQGVGQEHGITLNPTMDTLTSPDGTRLSGRAEMGTGQEGHLATFNPHIETAAHETGHDYLDRMLNAEGAASEASRVRYVNGELATADGGVVKPEDYTANQATAKRLLDSTKELMATDPEAKDFIAAQVKKGDLAITDPEEFLQQWTGRQFVKDNVVDGQYKPDRWEDVMAARRLNNGKASLEDVTRIYQNKMFRDPGYSSVPFKGVTVPTTPAQPLIEKEESKEDEATPKGKTTKEQPADRDRLETAAKDIDTVQKYVAFKSGLDKRFGQGSDESGHFLRQTPLYAKSDDNFKGIIDPNGDVLNAQPLEQGNKNVTTHIPVAPKHTELPATEVVSAPPLTKPEPTRRPRGVEMEQAIGRKPSKYLGPDADLANLPQSENLKKGQMDKAAYMDLKDKVAATRMAEHLAESTPNKNQKQYPDPMSLRAIRERGQVLQAELNKQQKFLYDKPRDYFQPGDRDKLDPNELRPALKRGKDGIVLPGEKGQIHAQLIHDNMMNGKLLGSMNDFEHWFVDTTGKYYNRDEAARAVGHTEGPLHSQDLNEMQGNTQHNMPENREKFRAYGEYPDPEFLQGKDVYSPDKDLNTGKTDKERQEQHAMLVAQHKAYNDEQDRIYAEYGKHFNEAGTKSLQTIQEGMKGHSTDLGMAAARESMEKANVARNKWNQIADKSPEQLAKNQPADRDRLGVTIPGVRSAIDAERVKSSPELADAHIKLLNDQQEYTGKLRNKPLELANKLTDEQKRRVLDVTNKERDSQEDWSGMLQTQPERNAYRAWRDALSEQFNIRTANDQPVKTSNGKFRKAKQDEWFAPSVMDKDVAQTIREGNDTQAIEKYHQDWLDKAAEDKANDPDKYKNLTDEKVEEEWRELGQVVRGDLGNPSTAAGNEAYFNGIRKQEGRSLPESMREKDLSQVISNYARRSASDMAWYKNVESQPAIAAAHGYTHDGWGKPIDKDVLDANPSKMGNQSTRDIVESYRGEAGHGFSSFDKTSHAAESAATMIMLGPATEVHKTLSSIASAVGVAKPSEVADVLRGITSYHDGWQKAIQAGSARVPTQTAKDNIRFMLDSHSTIAERLQGMAQSLRHIYTLGGFTDKFIPGFLHNAGEAIMSNRIALANSGDKEAAGFLRHYDPDYEQGKHYGPDELQQMAGRFANTIHGSRDARTLPSYMLEDTELSAFLKLAHWQISTTNSWMRNIYTPATKGNLVPLIMSSVGSVLGGYAIKEMREGLTNRKTPVPTWAELEASDANAHQGLLGRKIEDNKRMLAYNLMELSSIAGFGGIMSSGLKMMMDVAARNAPSGMGTIFPLDELVDSTARIGSNIGSAIVNGDSDWTHVLSKGVSDWISQNVQTARVGMAALERAGVMPDEYTHKMDYTRKLQDLRRFKEAAGLPYEDQVAATDENPYMSLEAAQYKREPDLSKAMEELPPILHQLVGKYSDRPTVLLAKLESLKKSNYETMPSMENDPLGFASYNRSLNMTEGQQAATDRLVDYLKQNAVNKIKEGVIP